MLRDNAVTKLVILSVAMVLIKLQSRSHANVLSNLLRFFSINWHFKKQSSLQPA